MGSLRRELPVSRTFFYVSRGFSSKSSPDEKISSLSRNPWERNIPFMFPKTGLLWKKMPVSRALCNIPFRVPSKEALPPGFPHRERHSISRALLHLSLKVPGESALHSRFSTGSPKEMPASRAFIYLSFRVPLTELPWREMLHFHSPPSSLSQSPQ